MSHATNGSNVTHDPFHEGTMSRMMSRMSHVTNEPCHEWAMSRMALISHIHMNMSRMSHVTNAFNITHDPSHEWAMTRIISQMSHVMNEPCHEWHGSFVTWFCPRHKWLSCHTLAWDTWAMSQMGHVTHEKFRLFVTWLIRDMAHLWHIHMREPYHDGLITYFGTQWPICGLPVRMSHVRMTWLIRDTFIWGSHVTMDTNEPCTNDIVHSWHIHMREPCHDGHEWAMYEWHGSFVTHSYEGAMSRWTRMSHVRMT